MKIATTLALTLALGTALPAIAQDQATAQKPDENPQTQVIRDTDNTLTCVQIADEALQLSEAMGGAPGGGVFGTLGGVVRSGAAMAIPGVGLVTALADVATRPARERREAEALAVQHRWYYLNGLYAGQRCEPAPAATAETPAPTE